MAGRPSDARLAVATAVGKTLVGALRRFPRRGGSALPGLVAERIDGQITRKLADQFAHGVIVITGTNGKTTTTRMVVEILERAGHRVLTNRSGSNLARGISSALIAQAGRGGRVAADVGVFEVDEASMPAVCEQLRPSVVVVLNFFRDQLDRYGELDTTAAVVGRALAGLEGATVCLNADDPLVTSLARYAENAKIVWFGVDADGWTPLPHDRAADSNHCPLCGRALEYDRVLFSHLGRYWCPTGHFERPPADVALTAITLTGEGSRLSVAAGGAALNLEVPLPGLYNAYNALAALAVAHVRSVGADVATGALREVTAAFGRVEVVDVAGRRLRLLLVKNPTGFNQIIQTFLAGTPGTVVMAINDGFADGRDLSWLWDVAVEDIAPSAQITCTGARGNDMALRLKYAERSATVVADIDAAVDAVVEATPPGDTAEILVNYTAMLALRAGLDRRATLKRFWQ
jgi:lipid II isoglutaminyl synthase (glutamine-hydrolysing)